MEGTGPSMNIDVSSLYSDNRGTSFARETLSSKPSPKPKGQHGGARPGSGRKRMAPEEKTEFSTLKIHRSLCERWCQLRKRLGLKSNSATAEYLMNLAELHLEPTVVRLAKIICWA